MKSLKKTAAVLISVLIACASAFSAFALSEDASGSADTKIYFDASSSYWGEFHKVMLYLYNMDSAEIILPWASKKTVMTDEGNGIYSFDLKDFNLDINTNYACIFNSDRGDQTKDILVNTPCFGHTVSCVGEFTGGTMDSNKCAQEVIWDSGVDDSLYGMPLSIDKFGRVSGTALPIGKTKYSVFVDFLKRDGERSVENVADRLGIPVQQLIKSVVRSLCLSDDDVKSAIAESGKDIEWMESKIYFDVKSAGWIGYKRIMMYLYNVDTGDVLLPWASKKTAMTDEGNGIYSFDLSSFDLDFNTNYVCVFNDDTGACTYDLLINTPCFGHTAYCTGKSIEDPVNYNKSVQEVKWDSSDVSCVYDSPIAITSIGNVIGNVLPKGQTGLDILTEFLKRSYDSSKGLDRARAFGDITGRTTDQEIIDYVAGELGLNKDFVQRAIIDSLRTVEWDAAKSMLPGGSGESSDYSVGDINLDRKVSVLDRIILTRHLANWDGYEKLSNCFVKEYTGASVVGDLNDDGVVNTVDRIILSRHLAGWEDYKALPYKK